MAEVTTPAPNFTYSLATQFYMPSDGGDRRAVAFSTKSATVLVAALSIAITVAFTCLWNIISLCAVYFYDGKSQRRYLALVMLRNSNGPWSALRDLSGYTFESFKGPGSHGDSWYGLAVCLVALLIFVGSIAVGIVAPSRVQIGNVAPVKPSMVFYPKVTNNTKEQLEAFGIHAPSVMRALGSVDSDRVNSRSHVKVELDKSYAPRGNDSVMSLTYGYSLSGVDLGLRGGSELALDVEGFCITEYGWEVEAPMGYSPDDADWYSLWNNPNETEVVRLNGSDTRRAPYAGFHLHPDGANQLVKDSNVSYAVVIHSAHRPSITNGSDPWYYTETRTDNATDIPYDAPRWMKRGRPVLSCWEQDRWRYDSETVASVFDLRNVTGIKIPEVLLDVLDTTFIMGPMIVRLSNASGDSALKSRTTSPNGVIDAEVSSMLDDMERLIMASFVATRSIFTDATMFTPRDNKYPNVFEGEDEKPRDGAGDFVVSSPDIQTFDLVGLVTLTVIVLSLFLANSFINLVIRFQTGRGRGGEKLIRFRVLEATQLFRRVLETRGVRLWDCGEPMPSVEVEEVLECGRCENRSCLGHIRIGGSDGPGSEADTPKDSSPLIHITRSEDTEG